MRTNLSRSILGCLLAALATACGSCGLATADSHMATVAEARYVADADGDSWQTPEETARRRAGDCEDLALYLHHLLRRDGLGARVVFGIRDLAKPTGGHAWVECVLDGDLYVLDPTCRLMCRRNSLPAHRYYALAGRFLAASLREKLRDYLARTGARGVNADYEAAVAEGGAVNPRGGEGEDTGH